MGKTDLPIVKVEQQFLQDQGRRRDCDSSVPTEVKTIPAPTILALEPWIIHFILAVEVSPLFKASAMSYRSTSRSTVMEDLVSLNSLDQQTLDVFHRHSSIV